MAKIITDKEYKKTKKGEGTQVPIAPKETVKKPELEATYECGFAPMGKSTTSFKFKHEGVERLFNLELDNKRYKIPADMNPTEKAFLRKALLANGFVDVSVFNALPKFNKQNGKWTYKVIHPEHTAQNPMNCNISLALHDDKGNAMFDKDGKQIFKQVAIVEGKIKTDDRLVYEALLKAGFMDAGKEEGGK